MNPQLVWKAGAVFGMWIGCLGEANFLSGHRYHRQRLRLSCPQGPRSARERTIVADGVDVPDLLGLISSRYLSAPPPRA